MAQLGLRGGSGSVWVWYGFTSDPPPKFFSVGPTGALAIGQPVTTKHITTTSWYLMTCSLPDLQWARLREYSDGTADLLEFYDGLHSFGSVSEARTFLTDEEFEEFDDLSPEDQAIIAEQWGPVRPPEARDDQQLRGHMLASR